MKKLYILALSFFLLINTQVFAKTVEIDDSTLQALIKLVEAGQKNDHAVINKLLDQNENNAVRVNENCRKKTLLEKLGLK